MIDKLTRKQVIEREVNIYNQRPEKHPDSYNASYRIFKVIRECTNRREVIGYIIPKVRKGSFLHSRLTQEYKLHGRSNANTKTGNT